MKLLDAVNLILPKLGERRVTNLEAKHPTLAILLPLIEQRLKAELLRGWWFNQYEYTAFPGTTGEIDLGTTTLSFVPEQEGVAVVRGRRLYNPKTLTYVFDAPVKGTVTQYVPFDDLPESAANFVFYSSLVEAYTTDLGVSTELQIWQTMAGSAWDLMLAEHLRQRKHTTRKSRPWRRIISALQG